MPTFIKLLGFGILVTLISFFFVQQDIRLKIWGKEALGEVNDVWMSSDGSLRAPDKVKVELGYSDEKGEYQKTEVVVKSLDDLTEDRKHIKIVYLPGGSKIVRIAGRSAWMSYVGLLVGLAMIGAGVHLLYNEPVVASHASEHPVQTSRIQKYLDR